MPRTNGLGSSSAKWSIRSKDCSTCTSRRTSRRILSKVKITMHLDPDGLRSFYKLYPSLLCFVNQRLGIMGTHFTVPEQFGGMPPDQRIKLRDALVANKDLIDAFVSENPFKLVR